MESQTSYEVFYNYDLDTGKFICRDTNEGRYPSRKGFTHKWDSLFP